MLRSNQSQTSTTARRTLAFFLSWLDDCPWCWHCTQQMNNYCQSVAEETKCLTLTVANCQTRDVFVCGVTTDASLQKRLRIQWKTTTKTRFHCGAKEEKTRAKWKQSSVITWSGTVLRATTSRYYTCTCTVLRGFAPPACCSAARRAYRVRVVPLGGGRGRGGGGAGCAWLHVRPLTRNCQCLNTAEERDGKFCLLRTDVTILSFLSSNKWETKWNIYFLMFK